MKKKKNSKIINAGYLAGDALSSLFSGNNKPHILIACMPKSASTFLATAISELPGFRRYRLVPAWGVREQELCPIRLSRYNRKKYVAQHHLRHSDWTAQLIKQYHMTPIVTVRNLADCAISLRDHYRKDRGAMPIAHMDKQHTDMADPEFEEAIVRLAMPWYINFYAGWKSAKDVPIYDYEDYTADPVKIITDMLARANTAVAEKDIIDALAVTKTKPTRFNVGTSGRGRLLSGNAKTALLRLLDCYPDLEDDPLFTSSRKTLTAD